MNITVHTAYEVSDFIEELIPLSFGENGMMSFHLRYWAKKPGAHPKDKILIGRIDGIVVGWSYLRQTIGGSQEYGCFVQFERRRQGLGTQLFHAAQALVRPGVDLRLSRHDQASRAFYDKLSP
jgi:GNAT superfamily N-acetyltransferase